MPSGSGAAPGSPNPFGSGVLFAKRKRNLFKGPTLNFGGQSSSRNTTSGSHSRSASASGLGRRSGEITIQEEDEAEEEEIEEVDMFSPVIGGPGEKIEEQIFEEDEPTPTTDMATPASDRRKEPLSESTSALGISNPTYAK